jgi:hypothetical protein
MTPVRRWHGIKVRRTSSKDGIKTPSRASNHPGKVRVVPAGSQITRFDGPIAEEELHAYVDGVLEADRRQAVEQFLQTHPDAARRVEIYIAQRQELRASA